MSRAHLTTWIQGPSGSAQYSTERVGGEWIWIETVTVTPPPPPPPPQIISHAAHYSHRLWPQLIHRVHFLRRPMWWDQSGLQAPSNRLSPSHQRVPIETRTRSQLQLLNLFPFLQTMKPARGRPCSRSEEWSCSCRGGNRPGPVRLGTQSMTQTQPGLVSLIAGGKTVLHKRSYNIW